MGRVERLELVKALQSKRKSKLITYVVGDRPNLTFQIAGDTPRLFYDHLIKLEKSPRIDLFLYSPGGDASVPWRIVTLFREFCDELSVLVPFRAWSAATMIAIGADQIVMGRKGELGPIDPTVMSPFNPIHPVSRQPLSINVEDVTAYISLLRDKVKLQDETALEKAWESMPNQVNPLALGYVHRHQEHIRLVATKLLKARRNPPSDEEAKLIVESLVEKMYFHGHGIGRAEAKDLGLPIEFADNEPEALMWNLYLDYERDMHLLEPFMPEDILEEHRTEDYTIENIAGAYIESESHSDVARGDVRIRASRQIPANVNISLNVQMPPGVDPNEVDPQRMQMIHQEVQRGVIEQIRRQSPIVGYDVRYRGRWQRE